MSQNITWAPITTAPRDGSPVWVRGDNYNDPRNGQHHCWAWWDTTLGTWFNAHTPDSSRLEYLTHWLPRTEATGTLVEELHRHKELLSALHQILGAHDASEEVLDAVSDACAGSCIENAVGKLLPYTPPAPTPPYADLSIRQRILEVLHEADPPDTVAGIKNRLMRLGPCDNFAREVWNLVDEGLVEVRSGRIFAVPPKRSE